MTTSEEHDRIWATRLQDWLDGDIAPADRTAFDAHLAGCALCQRQTRELETLDRLLQRATPRVGLDASFDARLWAQIDAADEARRVAARERIEREWQSEVAALTKSWRKTLLLIVPGIVAGIAVAFAIAGYVEVSGATQTLVREGASELGRSSAALNAALTTLIGGAVGGAVARWFASLTH